MEIPGTVANTQRLMSFIDCKQQNTLKSHRKYTNLLLKAPRISKIMSSNIVHEKAKVTEKTTWTT